MRKVNRSTLIVWLQLLAILTAVFLFGTAMFWLRRHAGR